MTHGEQLRHDGTSLNLLGQAVVLMLRRLLPEDVATLEKGSKHLADYFTLFSEQVRKQDALIHRLLEQSRNCADKEEFAQLEEAARAASLKADACSRAMNQVVTDMQFQDRHSQQMANICAILDIYGYLLEEEGRLMPALVDIVWLEAVEKALLSAVRLADLRHALLDAAREVGLPFPEALLNQVEADDSARNTESIELF